MKHELGPLFPPWPPQKVYDQIEKVVCKSEPPWIEEAAKIASDCYFGFGPSGKCEGWEEIVRAVLAFAARQPRPVTNTMVEAAARGACCEKGGDCDAANACVGHDMSSERFARMYGCESDEKLKEAHAALEAAEAARLWLGM